jgi:hypothetical protein
MKRLFPVVLLITAILLFAGSAYSQNFAVGKKAWIISGAVEFSSSSGDLYENENGDALTTISFIPSADYFVVPNVFVGGMISYSSASQGDFSMSALGIGPEVGYALGKAESKVFPFAKIGFQYLSNSWDSGDGTEKETGSDVTIAIGVIFPVKQHIGITPQLSYHIQSLKGDWEGAESVSGNILSVGVGITGLVY